MNRFFTVLAMAVFLLIPASSQTPQPQSAQPPSTTAQPLNGPAKPTPCTPSSVVPRRVHIGVPPWLQREINRQAARLGTVVDLKGAISDATAPKPCPAVAPAQPTAAPFPVQPKIPTPPPAPIVTLRCDPIGVDPAEPSGRLVATLPDPHKYQTPPPTNHFEADRAEPELGGSFACAALRVNPITHRYWLPSPISTVEVDVTPAQSQPNK